MNFRYPNADGPVIFDAPDADLVSVEGQPFIGGFRIVFTFHSLRSFVGSANRLLDGRIEIAAPNSIPKIGVAPLALHGDIEKVMPPAFALDFDLDRLEALNACREPSGDLKLRLDVALLLDGASGPRTVCSTATVNIPGSTWDAALASAQFGEVLLCRIEVRRRSGDDRLRESFAKLQDALGHLRKSRGDDKDSAAAVSVCRMAVEGGSLDGQRPPECPDQNKTKLWDKPQRLGALRWALKVLLHLAHHDATVLWSLRDARLVTAVTAALVEWEASSG